MGHNHHNHDHYNHSHHNHHHHTPPPPSPSSTPAASSTNKCHHQQRCHHNHRRYHGCHHNHCRHKNHQRRLPINGHIDHELGWAQQPNNRKCINHRAARAQHFLGTCTWACCNTDSIQTELEGRLCRTCQLGL